MNEVSIAFDRGYCCAVVNILRTHADSVIARDVLRANEPADWEMIDREDRKLIEPLRHIFCIGKSNISDHHEPVGDTVQPIVGGH